MLKFKKAYMISHYLKQKWTVNCYHVVAATALEEAISALLCTVQVKTKHSMFQPAPEWHGHTSNKLKYRENTVTGTAQLPTQTEDIPKVL